VRFWILVLHDMGCCGSREKTRKFDDPRIPPGGSVRDEDDVILDHEDQPVLDKDGKSIIAVVDGKKLNDPRIPPGGSVRAADGVILDRDAKPVLGKDGKPIIAHKWGDDDSDSDGEGDDAFLLAAGVVTGVVAGAVLEDAIDEAMDEDSD
jgi:hypothetical protein